LIFFFFFFSRRDFLERLRRTGRVALCAHGRDLRRLQGGCKDESRVTDIARADISQFIRVF
jgi:hypothetical protein